MFQRNIYNVPTWIGMKADVINERNKCFLNVDGFTKVAQINIFLAHISAIIYLGKCFWVNGDE